MISRMGFPARHESARVSERRGNHHQRRGGEKKTGRMGLVRTIRGGNNKDPGCGDKGGSPGKSP